MSTVQHRSTGVVYRTLNWTSTLVRRLRCRQVVDRWRSMATQIRRVSAGFLSANLPTSIAPTPANVLGLIHYIDADNFRLAVRGFLLPFCTVWVWLAAVVVFSFHVYVRLVLHFDFCFWSHNNNARANCCTGILIIKTCLWNCSFLVLTVCCYWFTAKWPLFL